MSINRKQSSSTKHTTLFNVTMIGGLYIVGVVWYIDKIRHELRSYVESKTHVDARFNQLKKYLAQYIEQELLQIRSTNYYIKDWIQRTDDRIQGVEDDQRRRLDAAQERIFAYIEKTIKEIEEQNASHKQVISTDGNKQYS